MSKTEKNSIKKATPKNKVSFKKGEYIEAVGRRKTAVARVRIYPKEKADFIVNKKSVTEYFPTLDLQSKIFSPLIKSDLKEKLKISVVLRGGGKSSQAEALRHGLSRVLVKFNPGLKELFKKAGFLTRDSRMRERKKFGLKRARRAPQWQKR